MKFKKHHLLQMILVAFQMAYLLFLSLGYLTQLGNLYLNGKLKA